MHQEDRPFSDDALWFFHKGCEGKHYIIGNPHIVPGRIWAWCPKEEVSFFLNKNDMEEMSEATQYWLKGYLSGNEPPPPLDEDGMPAYSGDSFEKWNLKRKRFHEEGVWE